MARYTWKGELKGGEDTRLESFDGHGVVNATIANLSTDPYRGARNVEATTTSTAAGTFGRVWEDVWFGEGDTAWVGGAFKVPTGSPAGAEVSLIRLDTSTYTGNATWDVVGAYLMADGKIAIVRQLNGESQVTLATGPTLTKGKYVYIELKFIFSNTDGVGITELWLDGNKVADSTQKNLGVSPRRYTSARLFANQTTGASGNWTLKYDNFWVGPTSYYETYVRSFNVGSEVVLDKGTVNGTGAFTNAALVRIPAGGTGSRFVLSYGNSAGDGEGGFGIVENGGWRVMMAAGGGETFDDSITLPPNEWAIIAVTKPAGSSNGTMHVYPLSTQTWSHGTGWTARTNMAATDQLVIGNWQTISNFWEGEIAVIGAWDRQLSQAQIESLATGLKTTSWRNVSGGAPQGLWQLNQESPAIPVPDSIGTAEQTFEENTSALLTSVNWEFEPYVEDVVPEEEAGTGLSGRFAKGADVFQAVESGTGLSPRIGKGSDIFTVVRTGLGLSARTGTGYSIGAPKFGTGRSNFAASGSDAPSFIKFGGGLSDRAAKGADIYTAAETGTGLAGRSASGTGARVLNTVLTFTPSDPDDDATPSFSFVSNVAGASFERRVDGGPWINVGTSGNASVGPLDSGSHTFEVRAVDAFGVDLTPASYTWTINLGIPSLPPYVPLEPKRAEWKFVLANSATMANIGELRCTNKQLDLVLNRSGSCSFSIPMRKALADQINVLTTCIKVYRKTPALGAVLIWSGPVWNIEDVVHNETMTVSAVGWFELLNHRLLRYEKRYTANDKTAGQIALDLLTIANGQKDGPLSLANPDGNGTTRPTGIAVGTTTDTGIKNRIYPQWQNIGQAITEWSDLENGFDMEITPDTKTMNLYISGPGFQALKRDRQQAQFGFNWGPHNLLEFSRTTESAELVNSQHAIGKFNTDALSQNTTSMASYGIWENQQALTDITDASVLSAFASAEVAIRSFPKVVYKILPHPWAPDHTHVPEPFVDYRLGDVVYVTANYSPRIAVNHQAMRVYGISLSIGDDGSEKISSLQVSP